MCLYGYCLVSLCDAKYQCFCKLAETDSESRWSSTSCSVLISLFTAPYYIVYIHMIDSTTYYVFLLLNTHVQQWIIMYMHKQ